MTATNKRRSEAFLKTSTEQWPGNKTSRQQSLVEIQVTLDARAHILQKKLKLHKRHSKTWLAGKILSIRHKKSVSTMGILGTLGTKISML